MKRVVIVPVLLMLLFLTMVFVGCSTDTENLVGGSDKNDSTQLTQEQQTLLDSISANLTQDEMIAKLTEVFPGQFVPAEQKLLVQNVNLAPANSDVAIWRKGPYSLFKNNSYGYEVQFRVDKVMQNGKEMYHSVIDIFQRQVSTGKVQQTWKFHSPTVISFWSVLSAGSKFLERAPFILLITPSCSACQQLGNEWSLYCQTFCGCIGNWCIQI